MLWLLDQYLEGVYACEDGGVTRRVMLRQTATKSSSLHLLYILAGMLLLCIKIIDSSETRLFTIVFCRPLNIWCGEDTV